MYKVDFGAVTGVKTIVDRETAKKNSNIEYDADDALFDLFLEAIALEIENYIGYPVLQREAVVVKLKYWESPYDLPFDFRSITSVNYRDSNNAIQDMEVEDYDIFGNEITFNIEKPSAYKGPVTITGAAGFITADMPAHFKDAALLMFSERETFRENRQIKMNTAAQQKLRPHKKY